MTTPIIDPTEITLKTIKQVLAGPVEINLPKTAWQAIERSRATIENALSADVLAYGINTGYGKLAKTRVNDNQLSALQHNLVRSHAAGDGSPLMPEIVRLVLCLKLSS